jgi:T5SS/PEP-CTERM-associated repeat protein
MPHPLRVARALGVIALLALAPGLAPAQPVTRSWNNAAGGPASTPGNWSPAGVPTGSDPLVFALAGTYPVTFDALADTSYSHTYRTGHVTLVMATPHQLSGPVTAGTLPGDAPTTILVGSLAAPLSSAIGSATGTNATFVVSGAGSQFLVTNFGADLRVGFSGTGTLMVDGGGLVQVNDDLRLGEQGGSNGTVTADGASTLVRTLGAAGDILVGISGSGTVEITGGAAVVAGGAVRVGSASGAAGRVHLADGSLKASDLDIAASGRLEGRGSVESPTFDNGGWIEVGDGTFGTLSLVGPFGQLAAGTLALDIGGSNAGQFDRITSTGAATLAGTLRLQFPPGAALAQGVAIPLVTASSIVGTFAAVEIDGFPDPAALAVTYTPTQVLLTLQAAVDVPAVPPPGGFALVGGRRAGAPAFRLDLPEAADARVELFDATGRRVCVLADRAFGPGSHRIELSAPGPVAGRPARGVYFGRATIRVAGSHGPERRLSDRIVVD